MTDTSALEPAEYLRRLFDDVEFSLPIVLPLAHGRSPTIRRPRLPTPSRSLPGPARRRLAATTGGGC